MTSLGMAFAQSVQRMIGFLIEMETARGEHLGELRAEMLREWTKIANTIDVLADALDVEALKQDPGAR